jgi:hypothetical protein
MIHQLPMKTYQPFSAINWSERKYLSKWSENLFTKLLFPTRKCLKGRNNNKKSSKMPLLYYIPFLLFLNLPFWSKLKSNKIPSQMIRAQMLNIPFCQKSPIKAWQKFKRHQQHSSEILYFNYFVSQIRQFPMSARFCPQLIEKEHRGFPKNRVKQNTFENDPSFFFYKITFLPKSILKTAYSCLLKITSSRRLFFFVANGSFTFANFARDFTLS